MIETALWAAVALIAVALIFDLPTAFTMLPTVLPL